MKPVSHIGATLLAVAMVVACGETPRSSRGGTWVAEHDTIGDTVIVRTISGSVGPSEYVLERELTIGVLDGPEE